jgi:hypothetical protein
MALRNYDTAGRNRVEWVGTRQRNDLKACPWFVLPDVAEDATLRSAERR